MAGKQREKILVVDEDPDTLELMAAQVLRPLGYEVATAQDGPTALQTALRLSPDILITSLDLPGLSGRDLLAALRSQGLETTIIATGPRGAEAQAQQAFRLGARDYVSKPVREAELVASVDRAMADVRLRQERQHLGHRLAAANQQLERRVKELTTLASIGKAVTALTNLGQLFSRLLEAGMFVTEAEVGWLVLADENSSKPVLRAAKNLPKTGGPRLNQPWDDGISPLLMASGEGLTVAGQALARLRAGQVAKAAAAVPLKARDQVLGVLVVGNRTGRPFTERDLAMLSSVADYAVIALINARLFQGMEQRYQALQQAYEQQTGASRRTTDAVRTPIAQARALLEQLLRGQYGPFNAHQAASLEQALERLRSVERLLEDGG